MGFLSFLARPNAPTLVRLPTGSFTMDRSGRIVVSTLPSYFSTDLLRDIGHTVLETFADAQKAQLPLTELNIQYGSLKVCARELRGGAIVFLSPFTPISINPKHLH